MTRSRPQTSCPMSTFCCSRLLGINDLQSRQETPFLKQLRAALYARVSTDDKGQDPLNQLLQLRQYAASQGWEIVQEYTDEVSAKNGDRAGFKQMWADAAK